MKIDFQATYYLAMHKDGEVIEDDEGRAILFETKTYIENCYSDFIAIPVKLARVDQGGSGA